MRYTPTSKKASSHARRGLAAAASASMLATLLAAPAGAYDPVPVDEGLTQWISKEAGASGGRELPSVSADGRYVAYVGRGEGQGVWLTDRTAKTTTRLTTGSHFNPAVSDDGRYVAFVEYGAERSVKRVEVATGVIEMVSLNDAGAAASGLSDFPSISADGRYVAFQSSDQALDDDVTEPPAGGGPNRAYVRDLVADETEMVGVTDQGEASQGSAIKPDISPDGRFVAFAAEAANLLPPVPTAAAPAEEEEEETSAPQQVYLRDRAEGTTTLVSVGTDGLPGDATSAPVFGPTVSDDGSKVAFESLAANLVEGDTNADVDAFVRDRGDGSTVRVSLDSGGNQVDLPNPVVVEPTTTTAPAGAPTGDETVADPMVGGAAAISGDGNVVAFQSEAPLTPDDLNGAADNLVKDVYAVDFAAGTFERVSLANEGGTEATGTRTDGHTGATVPQTNGADPAIDGKGHYVAFVSNGNLTGDRPVAEEEAGVTAEADAEEEVSTEAGIFDRLRLDGEGWYVKAAYSDLLARPADTGGLVYWVERLWRTGDEAAFASSMTTSTEYRRIQVRAAYQLYLERPADPSGESYWVNKLGAGTSVESMEAQMLGSNEAFRRAGSTNQGFVTYAFAKVLSRAADPSGASYWLAKLDGGTSRTTMASSLIRSSESARKRVDATYQQLLDRAPTSTELSAGVASLTGGASKVSLVRSLVASDEYVDGAEAHLND
jgi:Tol biopolymer transport system component